MQTTLFSTDVAEAEVSQHGIESQGM